jgi:Ca-activated chloride channel family protein
LHPALSRLFELQQNPQQQKPAQQPTPSPTPQQQQKPAATAPTPAESGDDEVVRVSSNLVVVPVSVSDANGDPVRGLKQGDFRIAEAGKPQEIARLGDPEQVPLDIALLFDLSSSVKERFAFQQEAASRFLKEVLRPTDSATIFSIDQKPRLVQARGSVEAAVKALQSFQPANVPTPTAFYDSVTAAALYLSENAPKDHRRVILVISDGDDNFSAGIRDAAIADYEASKGDGVTKNPDMTKAAAMTGRNDMHRRAVQNVQRAVQRADTVFYSINPSGESIRLNQISMRAENGMESTAQATGGTAFVPNTDQDLERVFRQIAAELRAQYLLQYYSNDESPTGKFIPIKVTIPAQSQLRIRARQGYYAKKH